MMKRIVLFVGLLGVMGGLCGCAKEDARQVVEEREQMGDTTDYPDYDTIHEGDDGWEEFN